MTSISLVQRNRGSSFGTNASANRLANLILD